MQLPVYIINLDRRPDRWEAISEHLDDLGIAHQRVPAADARDLSEGDRPWRINKGSAANLRSHAIAMRRLLESEAPGALILEDDAELSVDTSTLLHSADWWPDGAKVIRLEGVHRRPRLVHPPIAVAPNGREIRRMEGWIGGSAAYLVTRAGALIALEGFALAEHTVDGTLFDLGASRTARRLRPYQIVPPMARQRYEIEESDITPWREHHGKHRQSVAQRIASVPYKARLGILIAAGRVQRADLIFRDSVNASMPGSSFPISCYIRTLNEEARIGVTVRAALQIASEVIVVDSYSKDGTIAAAEAAGARVIRQTWLGYGHQKRVGEEACGNDWLLDLDADEVVSPELAHEIRTVFASGAPDLDACLIPVPYVEPSGRVWRRCPPRKSLKLYDRRKIRMPAHAAWDQPRVPTELRVVRLGGALLHHAFEDIGHLSRKQRAHAIRLAEHVPIPSTLTLTLRVFLGYPWFFFREYALRGRWMEGRYGFLAAVVRTHWHWYRYALLYKRAKGRLRGS